MASVKTEAPAQEQPAPAPAPAPASAPAPSTPNPNLDMLQGMLNLVLLTAGRFIKEHQAGGGTGRMKQGMQRAVPVATERFHDALDQLENEVRLAQTVLRRDLALLKQHRKKREAAAKQHEVERARLAAESSLTVPAKQEEVAVKPEHTTPAALPEAPPLAVQPVRETTPEADVKPQDGQPHPPPALDRASEPPADPLFDGTPTNSNPQEQEFDFDFEFGDSMDTSANNGHNGDMMDTSGDMDFSLDEGPSLLRGLEDFAKSSGDDNSGSNAEMDIDFPMPDLPDMSTDAKPPAEQPKPAAPVQQPPAQVDDAKDTKPVQETAETKAPDETIDTATADEPLETMVTDDLEDLFNLDDYDNPEGGDSAFNDAFFNFD